MNKKLLKNAICFLMLITLAMPLVSLAADSENNYGLDDQVQDLEIPTDVEPETALTDVVVNVINIVLGLLALIAVIIVLIAGFEWMTASGKEDQVTRAKDRMKQGLIGLVIIFLAYAIVAFVISKLASDLIN